MRSCGVDRVIIITSHMPKLYSTQCQAFRPTWRHTANILTPHFTFRAAAGTKNYEKLSNQPYSCKKKGLIRYICKVGKKRERPSLGLHFKAHIHADTCTPSKECIHKVTPASEAYNNGRYYLAFGSDINQRRPFWALWWYISAQPESWFNRAWSDKVPAEITSWPIGCSGS